MLVVCLLFLVVLAVCSSGDFALSCVVCDIVCFDLVGCFAMLALCFVCWLFVLLSGVYHIQHVHCE